MAIHHITIEGIGVAPQISNFKTASRRMSNWDNAISVGGIVLDLAGTGGAA